ncbi:MAG TPA: glycosyltransferase [Roseiflexaceae bacterium]|nr:glycosyltransferase [Roseiflexaceae bacterium]
MNHHPVVAIITPYYNTGVLFNQTVASLLRQTLQQWEWAIVNDGSTDPAALALLQPLRERGDPRIRVIDQPNRGLPAARNAGAAATTAPLLFFLDSDDLIAPTALEKLAWLLHSDERPAFATGWTRVFGSEELRWPRGFETRDHFLFQNMATPMTMIRRAVFEAVGGFDEARTHGLEDYELWLRCAARGFWGRDIPEYLVCQRHKTPQQYAGYSWPARDDPRHNRQFHQEMRALYPTLYRDGLPRLPAADDRPFAPIPQALPFENHLAPAGTRRVLLLLSMLDYGGVSTFALAMLEQLKARGYHCTIVTTMPNAHALQNKFERYADVFIPERFLRRADYPRFLRYLIESRGINAVLISNSTLGYRMLPYLRAHCPRVALTDYNHMRDPDCANAGNPGFSAEYHELLDLHMVSSHDLRDWMIARGAPPEHSAVVYTSADTEHWRPDPATRARVRAEFAIPNSEPVILYAARITGQKQPKLFARVLLALSRRGLSFRCLVAGDGPDLPWLRRFFHANNLSERVSLLGAVDAEHMRALMAASDILFLPSAYEGLALVLFEALASGVVPVTVDSGGQRELVTPDCGILVAPDDRQEARYTAALEWLIRSPRQRLAMSAAGRQRVADQFSTQQMGRQLDNLLAAACERAKARETEPAAQAPALVAASLAVEELRQYQRNHRFRAAVGAWEWWKRRGGGYAGQLRDARDRFVLRSYPLRMLLRPFWRRMRYRRRHNQWQP